MARKFKVKTAMQQQFLCIFSFSGSPLSRLKLSQWHQKGSPLLDIPTEGNTWTMNFQMFKLVLEKAEEPEIKLPTCAGSSKKQKFQKNTYFCFIDYAKAFDCVDHNKLWKILKEMGISDNLTCLLRNLYASQEATVRTGHVTTDWFQMEKGVCQGCVLSPCLFNLHAE